MDFYTDIYHGFEAKGGIDLSVGQGTAAKAALQLRLPYFGFALTDQHCLHIEKLLTESVLDNMAQESSTFYRPEMEVADIKKKEDEAKKPKAMPAPKKMKRTKPKQDDEGQDGAEKTEEPDETKPKGKNPRQRRVRRMSLRTPCLGDGPRALRSGQRASGLQSAHAPRGNFEWAFSAYCFCQAREGTL